MTAPAVLSAKQQDSILDADARINLFHGSIRSGKTVASIVAWLMYVRTAPPGPLAMVGKTRDTISRNVLDVIADIAPSGIAYTRGATTARIVGRLVHVVGANDARAESRLRGLTLAGAYVDEATLVPEAFWTQLLGRLSVPGARLFATTNPDSPAHWLKKSYLDRAADLDLYTVHYKLEDNPSLDPAYVANLKLEYTGLWYKRFIDGLWVAAEGAIFDMLDETVHTGPAPPRSSWERAWVTLDYGTSNPTHALLMVLADDRLWIVSEWEHDGRKQGQLTDAAISTKLAEWATPLIGSLPVPPITVLDPSAASLRTQMRADGWPGLRNADNRVDVGIRNTASLFAGGKLVVDRGVCPVLWDQLCGYVWDDTALDRGIEQPVKQDDHGPDALRYGIMAARQVWRHWLPDLADDTSQQDAA